MPVAAQLPAADAAAACDIGSSLVAAAAAACTNLVIPAVGYASPAAAQMSVTGDAAASPTGGMPVAAHLLRGDFAIVDKAMPPGISASDSTPGFTLVSDSCTARQ
jgi:hypothetical protein